jgi:hypothetical protein
VAGAADAVAGGEQTFDGGHTVVDLAVAGLDLVGIRDPVEIGAGDPQTAAAGVGTEQVRFGRHDFGVLLFRLAVLGAPQVRLTAGHVEEVFPRFGLEVLEFLLVHGGLPKIGQRGDGVHDDGAAAFLHLEQHQVVAQTGRGDGSGAVRRVVFQLCLGGVAAGEVFAQTVEGFGLEQQEPGTNRDRNRL